MISEGTIQRLSMLSATAGKKDISAIKESLNWKSPLHIAANPDRKNIFYEKVFKREEDVDFFEETLRPIAVQLKERTVAYPLTVLYLPLNIFQSS